MKSNALASLTFTKILSLFFLTVFATSLCAQTKLSVQGLLKKSDGTSLPDGNYNLKFRFYDAENGGALVGTSDANSTEINGGVYSTLLDPGALPFDVPYFVSVAVDGGTELLPRIALSAAPYAISLQGTNNKFPSVGTVKADAIDVAGAVSAASYGAVNATTVNATSVSATGAVSATSVSANGAVSGNHMTASGGAPSVGVAGKGYSFGAGGDSDGGLFSVGDNNVALYANATKALEANNGGVSIPGSLNVAGTITGAAFQATTNLGMYFGGNDLGLRSPSSGANNRILIAGNGVNVYEASVHSFSVGGSTVASFSTPQSYNNNVDNITSSVKFFGIQKGPNSPQVEWDLNTGELQVDNSSRRLKRNIRPMDEDFTKILKVQPKFYNRIGYPDSLIEAGYIAEEFDSLGLQPLVHYYANGDIFGISYDRIALYLTEIVKTQHADIEQLKAEVAALTAEKNTLRTENTSLHADMQNQQADFGKQFGEITRRLKSLETAASNR